MKCPNPTCISNLAYQPLLGKPECPSRLCKFFTQRRFDEVFPPSTRKTTQKIYTDIALEWIKVGDEVWVEIATNTDEWNGWYEIIYIDTSSAKPYYQCKPSPLHPLRPTWDAAAFQDYHLTLDFFTKARRKT